MVGTASKPELSQIEKFLLALDVGTPGALYRMLLGAMTVPAERMLSGGDDSALCLSLLLLGVLVVLRVGASVIRRFLPHGAELKEAWSVRRRTAKYFDSYQWRKLLWFGLGLAAYISLSTTYTRPSVSLATFCVAAGAAGSLRWRFVASDARYAKPVARKIRSRAA
jgi:hypothetical protein